MKIQEILEDVSQAEADQITKFASALWHKLGIDIHFGHHFMTQLNNKRNTPPITSAEIIRMFKKQYQYNGKHIANMGDAEEGVMKDILTSINLPFMLKDTPSGKELIPKTVLRQQRFFSQDEVFTIHEDSLRTAH
jgi:hypothetical protein